MEEITEDQFLNIPFRVTARILTLKIDKNVNFNSKIIWKRHQHKVSTNIVPHIDGYSTYDQNLTLQLLFKYNKTTQQYVDKMTRFLPAIVTQKGLKSGGEAKFNVSDPLNKDLVSTGNMQLQFNQTLLLQKCPDQTGYIQVFFNYQRLDQSFEIQISNIQNSQINSIIQKNSDSIMMPLISNINSINIQNFQTQTGCKEESFFGKKSSILSKRLTEQQRLWNQQKQEFEMKLLMMQEEMKQLKNRLIDKDEELKHTKAWNQSLLRSSQEHLSKIKVAQLRTADAQSMRLQKQVLERRVQNLQQQMVQKAAMIGNLLNAACDIGGRSLLNRLYNTSQNDSKI